MDIFRFTRVVFGLTSSPFLLNVTIQHHLQKLSGKQYDKDFIQEILQSIYVDDFVGGSNSTKRAGELYRVTKEILGMAGFATHKYASNCSVLYENEFCPSPQCRGFGGLCILSKCSQELGMPDHCWS